MAESYDAARSETLAALARSRAEIRQILDPPRVQRTASEPDSADAGSPTSFPRSRTMRLLMSGRGLTTAGAVVGGLFIARPALAFRLLRMIPAGAVARMLMVRAISALRSKQ